MIAMEPPSTNDADAIRDEKLKVLKSLRPFTPESVARDVVRGQYKAGNIEGQAVKGYLDELKVPPGSTTETFVALCAPRCRTGAGPACRFTCAPASAWPAGMRRSSSTSAACPHPIFPGLGAGQAS